MSFLNVIISQLDYCNSMYAGFPNSTVDQFQLVTSVPLQVSGNSINSSSVVRNHGVWIDNAITSSKLPLTATLFYASCAVSASR
jgi:hypothetical protein